MKEQVLASSEFESKKRKRFSSDFKWATFHAILSIISLYLLVIGNTSLSIIVGICFISLTLSSIESVYSMIENERMIKDIHKNRMFLDNEELLNKKVKSSPNILLNATTKTKELVSSTPEAKPVFTLNTIDKMKYEELKTYS